MRRIQTLRTRTLSRRAQKALKLSACCREEKFAHKIIPRKFRQISRTIMLTNA